MTREEAIDIIQSILDKYEENECLGTEITIGDEDIKAFKMAIKELEQKPCKDCISREWLKTAMHNFYQGLMRIPTEEDIQAYIDVAPSVNPQESKADALDKIRAEIRNLDDINPDYPMDRTIHISRNEVLNIIDKYRQER